MRVGLFTNNYLPFRGGVTTAVETLRLGLEGLGHRAWVFAPAAQHPHLDPPFVFRYPSIPAPTYPGFSLPLPVSRRLRRLARSLDLDVVHVHHPFLLGVTGRRLARGQRRPLVFTYHTRYEKYAHYVPLPPRLVRSLAVRLACRFADSADLVVAPSEHVLDAFESVSAAVSTATLHLVGKGSHSQALEARAAAGRARRRIVFHGGLAREALPDYYRAADLFLFASETETQGLVLAEAHACGLPAVAVRASGVDEVVRDGETGLLTKADVEELADAAIGLLLDAPRRSAMAVAARALAESDFCAARQVEVMAGHYRRLAGGSG